MDDRTLTIAGLIILTAVIAAWIYQYLPNDTPAPQATPTVQKPVRAPGWRQSAPSGEGTISCGNVTSRCTAQATIRLPKCIKKVAENSLKQLLAKPMESDGCSQIEDELEANCPSGCNVDYSSLVIIPTSPRFKIVERLEDSTTCVVAGTRDVTVRAPCVGAKN